MDERYIDNALMLKALGEPTRIKIFNMVSFGELCACELLEQFNITQPTLSYHMKILIEANLINSIKDGKWMKYSVNKESLKVLNDFFGNLDIV
ncbi:MAG: ArsR/SmtB family transcription factor [Senegalia sp. (in: firmicutes)]|uniref:ArsR/SmtB family transcription factor n=1 Tax=Senegalia sp. (in: firmicutes) TaxID=1924098 RepID=UPI003F9C14DA